MCAKFRDDRNRYDGRSSSPVKQEPKVVLITGAAKRIGAHIAKTLHDAEMRVLVHYHQSATAAARLVEDLNNLRADSAHAVAADLSDLQAIKELAHAAQNRWGHA